MACISKKDTDRLMSEIIKHKSPVWEDIALVLDYDVRELKSILIKASKDSTRCSGAEEYFVTKLRQTLAALNVHHFDQVIADPTQSKWALELANPRYSTRFVDFTRKLCYSFLEQLREEVGEDSETYKNMLRRFAQLTTAEEVMRIDEILKENIQ